MKLDFDLIMFFAFLAINLSVGLFYGRGVKNIRDYATGGRDFSIATLTATLVATWVGAGTFQNTLIETYRQGLACLIPALLSDAQILLIAYFFIPRMTEFIGNLSIAECMGSLFGKNIRIITACIALLRCVGILAIQFKLSAKIFELIFGASGMWVTLTSAGVVIIYSTFGGIRAVTFTDVIQFLTFGTIIPILLVFMWHDVGGYDVVSATIANSPLFSFSGLLNAGSLKTYNLISIIILFAIPQFSPSVFQRILMAKDIKQAQASFKIASLFIPLISLSIAAMSVFVLADNPNLDPENVLKHIFNKYSYMGLKGLCAIGVMAMVMSTADSLINSMSVTFAHDICGPLNLKSEDNFFVASKFFALFSGVCALLIAFCFSSIFKLIITVFGFYVATVAVPFILAVLGFRSSATSVLIGMFGAVGVGALLKFLYPDLDPYGYSAIANAVFLFASHYLLRQKGGWIEDKDPIAEQ